MAQFSMELRELEEVSTLNNLSHEPVTQLDTQAIMYELSADSEVTFRKVMGPAEILPTRPGIESIRLRIPGPWNYRRTGVVCSLRQ